MDSKANVIAFPGARGDTSSKIDLMRFPRSPLDFRFHVITARVEDRYESELEESVARCVASGVSEHPEIAEAAAIGEAWERIAFVESVLALRTHPTEPVPTDLTADSLSSLPFLLPHGLSRREWGIEALRGPAVVRDYARLSQAGPSSCRIPARVVAGRQSGSLFETTNGFACARTFEDALDRGVREIIERDALMLVWLGRAGGRSVDPHAYLEPEHCEQIERLRWQGVRTVVRDISTGFGCRVYLVAITASFPGGRVGIGFGAGAHRDARRAATHAFREACLSWRGVSWRALTRDRPEGTAPPRSFADHSEYYSSWDRMHLLDFLLDDRPGNRLPTIPAARAQAPADGGHVDLLLDQGLEVLAADVTPPHAAEAGFVVVQAIVPGLVPLYVGDRGADELAERRFPVMIGGVHHGKPDRLNSGYHPWP